jgi:hypothetical protein
MKKLQKNNYFWQMKKIFRALLVLLFFVSLTSMALHKFYVSVNQIDFVPKKKALEISSRIFIDDLDAALEKKFKKKAYLATPKEASDSKELLQKYFDEKIFDQSQRPRKAASFSWKRSRGQCADLLFKYQRHRKNKFSRNKKHRFDGAL